MTSLRDPMIWKMYNKIVALVDNALKMLPPYAKNELYFPGVEVISVDVKKMTTNFEYFEFDITQALKIGNGDSTFQVKVGQQRLNHKPYTVKVNISSLVTQKSLVKIYLGPKIMPGEFAKKKNMFNLLDSFELNLKRGSNIVTRTSNDMKMFAPDFTSLKTMYKKVEDAQFGLDSLSLNSIESQINFPERLTIPKGTPEGLPLQLFVFVAPFMKMTGAGAYLTPNLEFNSAVLQPLYPLDLMMEDRILLDLPNALVKDFTVTQKGASGAKLWNGNTNGPPSRPNMYNNGNDQQFEENGIHFNANEFSRPNTDYYYEKEQNGGLFTKTKPSKLSAGYDYSSSSKQPYDYKSKQVDYKALYQNKTTDLLEESQNKLIDTALMNDNQVIENIQEEHPTDKDSLYQTIDEINDNVQNDDSTSGLKHYLLKSSGSTSLNDQKDTIDDDKAKMPKIVIPNYKKMYKNVWKTTASPAKINSKYVIRKEDKIKTSNDDNVDSVSKVESTKVYKIISDDNDLTSKAKTNKKNYILIEDGNVEIIKVLDDKTSVDVPSSNLPIQHDEVIVDEEQILDNENYFQMYKDDSQEFTREVSAAETPLSKAKTIYYYLTPLLNDN